MARSFGAAFEKALPLGIQAGQQQQQLQIQQERAKQQEAQAMWEQLGAIMKLPAGKTREAFLQLGSKQYQQMTGSEFPAEIIDLLNKGSEEELSVWTEAAQAFSEFGFSVPAVAKLMQTNPGAVAQMFTAVTGARAEKRKGEELAELQRIVGGQEAPEGMGGGPSRMGGNLDSLIADRKAKMKQLMGLSSPEARALRDDLRAEITQMQSEQRAITQDERASRNEARADARAAQADARSAQANSRAAQAFDLRMRESILSEEGFNRRMAIASAGTEAREAAEAKYRPLPAAAIAEQGKAQALLNMFDETSRLYSPSFVGPGRGRIGTIGEKVGMTSKEEVGFRQTLASIKNQILQLRSGGQVTGGEAQRIEAELPSYTDPPQVFETKLRQARKLANDVVRSKAEALKQGGYPSAAGGKSRLNKPVGEMSNDELLDYLNQEAQ
jgi:hypothetical protein